MNRNRVARLMSRRSRKSQQLAQAMTHAQAFKYVDYYGYRYWRDCQHRPTSDARVNHRGALATEIPSVQCLDLWMNAVSSMTSLHVLCHTWAPVHSTLLADMGFLLGELARVQTNQHFIIWRDLGKVNKTCHSGHSAYTIIFYILKPNTKSGTGCKSSQKCKQSFLLVGRYANIIICWIHLTKIKSILTTTQFESICFHLLSYCLYVYSASCQHWFYISTH